MQYDGNLHCVAGGLAAFEDYVSVDATAVAHSTLSCKIPQGCGASSDMNCALLLVYEQAAQSCTCMTASDVLHHLVYTLALPLQPCPKRIDVHA